MTLRNALKNHLIEEMISKSRGSPEEYVVLVVDPVTTKILSSCARMYDIMETGVLVLENLMLAREKLDFSAIYFISSTPESISKLLEDFGGKKPQYSSVHLYFTGHVSSAQMKQIKEATKLLKRIKTFVELNVNFVSTESRVFTLGRQPSENILEKLYMSTREDLKNELNATSQQLTSLLLTLKEYPYIRYASNSGQGLCKNLAKFVEEDMKKKITQLKDWKYNEKRPRGTLLIVDRAIDPLAPVMHEYTYQAMVNDLLQVNGELCTLPANMSVSKEDSQLVLSEDDNLWMEFRHQHIGQVLHDVTRKLGEFKGTNSMAKLQSAEDGSASVKDMIAAMKEMPKYKDMIKKYAKHMSLAEACMGKFDTRKLKELGELEQDMATGVTEAHLPVSDKAVKVSLIRMCRSADVNVLDKLRLLMVYIISQGGLQEATRRELMKTIDSRLQSAIINLDKLGVDLAAVKKKNKAKHSKSRLAEFAKRAKTIPMALMRYVPNLHQVVSECISHTLSKDDFPYVSPPPAGHGKQKSQAKSARQPREWRGVGGDKKDSKEDSRPYFIVFVLGGVTTSEMRSIYELGDQMKANVLIGSTNIWRPSEYIRSLSQLNTKQFRQALEDSQGETDPDDLPTVNHDEDEDDDDDEEEVDPFNVRIDVD